MTDFRKAWVLVAAVSLRAGCTEAGPVVPGDPHAAGMVRYLTC